MPNYDLSISEQMIGTKARINFIQCMPKKKKGVKIQAPCGSVCGYCLQFQVYSGKVEGKAGKGLVSRVVLDLMVPYI